MTPLEQTINDVSIMGQMQLKVKCTFFFGIMVDVQNNKNLLFMYFVFVNC